MEQRTCPSDPSRYQSPSTPILNKSPRMSLLGSGLLINLQFHHQATNAQRVEGTHIHISPTIKVPYEVARGAM